MVGINPFGDSTIGVASAWLGGLSRRSKAISDNIANIDTPGYRAKEVPFETELRQALGNGGVRLATTSPGHLAVAPSGRSGLGLQDIQSLTSQRMDGNNVDIDAQMTSLTETQMRYQAAASALSTRLATLKEVIRGQ
jgi:flagellar basal-body rod protein FlgB